MAIDPEVIPPSSNEGSNAVSFVPKWLIFSVIGLVALLVIGIVKTLFPLILMALLISFIWNQASK